MLLAIVLLYIVVTIMRSLYFAGNPDDVLTTLWVLISGAVCTAIVLIFGAGVWYLFLLLTMPSFG